MSGHIDANVVVGSSARRLRLGGHASRRLVALVPSGLGLICGTAIGQHSRVVGGEGVSDKGRRENFRTPKLLTYYNNRACDLSTLVLYRL